MSVSGASGLAGGSAIPQLEDLSPEAREAHAEMAAARGEGPDLILFDQAWNVEDAAMRVRLDGTIDLADVVVLVREAKDLGGINGDEHEALARLLREDADLFTQDAYEALAAYMRVAVPPFSWYTLHASQARNNRAIERIAPGLVTTHRVGSGSLHNRVPGRYFGTP